MNEPDKELLQLLDAKYYLMDSYKIRGNIYIQGLFEFCDKYIEILVNIKKKNREKQNEIS